jgi:hypothetical protein
MINEEEILVATTDVGLDGGTTGEDTLSGMSGDGTEGGTLQSATTSSGGFGDYIPIIAGGLIALLLLLVVFQVLIKNKKKVKVLSVEDRKNNKEKETEKKNTEKEKKRDKVKSGRIERPSGLPSHKTIEEDEESIEAILLTESKRKDTNNPIDNKDCITPYNKKDEEEEEYVRTKPEEVSPVDPPKLEKESEKKSLKEKVKKVADAVSDKMDKMVVDTAVVLSKEQQDDLDILNGKDEPTVDQSAYAEVISKAKENVKTATDTLEKASVAVENLESTCIRENDWDCDNETYDLIKNAINEIKSDCFNINQKLETATELCNSISEVSDNFTSSIHSILEDVDKYSNGVHSIIKAIEELEICTENSHDRFKKKDEEEVSETETVTEEIEEVEESESLEEIEEVEGSESLEEIDEVEESESLEDIKESKTIEESDEEDFAQMANDEEEIEEVPKSKIVKDFTSKSQIGFTTVPLPIEKPIAAFKLKEGFSAKVRSAKIENKNAIGEKIRIEDEIIIELEASLESILPVEASLELISNWKFKSMSVLKVRMSRDVLKVTVKLVSGTRFTPTEIKAKAVSNIDSSFKKVISEYYLLIV